VFRYPNSQLSGGTYTEDGSRLLEGDGMAPALVFLPLWEIREDMVAAVDRWRGRAEFHRASWASWL
jgi:hypothetical protein